MKIAMMSLFDQSTASGITLRGKADALASLNQDVRLIYYPFKNGVPSRALQTKVGPRLSIHTLYSRFFAGSGVKKLLRLPALLGDIIHVYRLLSDSDVVIFHKPLPQTLLFQIGLTLTRRRARQLCIYDDWEGIGGIATSRYPEKVFKKLVVSLAEEYVPIFAHVNVCSSKLLADRFRLSKRTEYKTIYLPGGGPSSLAAGDPACNAKASDRFTIGYAGTFKSRYLIDFLVEVVMASLERDPSLCFVLIGGGEEEDYLRERLRSCLESGGVVLTGQLPHSKAQDALRQSDVCLLYLNDRFPEAYADASRSSVKLFEYMALGKPLVASRFGEPAAILRHARTAWLTENDPGEFSRGILALKSRPAIVENMGKKVKREFSQIYAQRVLMEKLLQTLTSEVARR